MSFDKCKLIWKTENAEKIISYCCRVSNPKNQDNENIEGLLKYCIKNGHWSILQMASMCVEINTTRAISSQIIRHRSLNIQEFSQRYASVEMDLEIPQLRRQCLKNRQMSIDDLDEDLVNELQYEIKKHFEASNLLYKRLQSYGVAKECCRAVLPMNSPTRMYVSATLRDWFHFLNVRTHISTQKECRVIALEIKKIFQEHFPIIGKLLD